MVEFLVESMLKLTLYLETAIFARLLCILEFLDSSFVNFFNTVDKSGSFTSGTPIMVAYESIQVLTGDFEPTILLDFRDSNFGKLYAFAIY